MHPLGAVLRSDVTVIVVNYRSKYLGDVLRSLLDQTVRPEQVIVVDNASGDDARSVVGQFDFAEFIDSGSNVGFAAANNLGARVARCNWLALLNHDAFAAPDWIEQLVRARERFPEYDTFACRMVLHSNPSILDGAGDAYRTDGLAWSRHRLEAVGSDGDTPVEVFGGSGAAVLYRRDVFLKLGGFDERFFCYYEDVDLAFRLRLNGSRCLYVPAAIVRHVGSAVAVRGSDFTDYHAHRNMVWTWVKNHPRPWRYIWAHVAANLVTVAWFVAKGRGKVILRAKWDAWRAIRTFMRERRSVDEARADEVIGAMEKGNAFRSIALRLIRSARTRRD